MARFRADLRAQAARALALFSFRGAALLRQDLLHTYQKPTPRLQQAPRPAGSAAGRDRPA